MTFRTFSQLGKEEATIRHIAQNLSEQNRQEAELIYPSYPLTSLLMNQASHSKHGFVIYTKKGAPCGIGGIMGGGRIWFVVTESAKDELCTSWFKQGRAWLKERLTGYHRIDGYCWEKNTLSQNWMRFMGFDITTKDNAATLTINGENFLYFMQTR